jgi:hypothetical protein
MSMNDVSAENTGPQGEIIARAASYYRMTRYIMVAMLIGMGLWFAYDGWVAWPRSREEFKRVSAELDVATAANDQAKRDVLLEEQKKYADHTDMDILFQRVLGFVLPPLGVLTLFWALRNSRGEYRLVGETVHIPGHSPVNFDQIRRLDKKLWDRKGIAYVDYEVDGASELRRFRLDDFVYERKPTDQIYDRINAYVSAQQGPSDEPGEPENEDSGGSSQIG